mgnify:CR=1 FL=1|tara:strand:- start:1185 stop:1853 length:669 start_codon:yes stop_codon:yes gene_type:complete
MAVSGSKDFELDVADYIEEAFERCGLEVRTGYDLKTAKRSMNIMFADWANRGLNQWTIAQRNFTVTKGDGNERIGAEIIDILSLVIRRDGTDYALNRISRDEYLNIPTKSTVARPTQFFVDRQINPVLQMWPLPDNSTDLVIYDALVRMDDADSFTNTTQVPFRFYPALAAGLAYYISMKRAPDRAQLLKATYEEEMNRAMDEDRDRASFRVAPDLRSYRYV